ncbi:hypothetical protein B5F08_03320 [Anaeromassilibacillus sp. An172]|uniref:leucine-rich repeat protein n=1 Tax=Anaeromassilibacillus sp. An172 TaxID=1965570 RepID=UPI000B39CD49|nr:leucine-rich repeat protein [Anaeromassilibacillus sp. An172]OUP79757.1 hypothetical protein B5F08_03320 [Anaeromassilibacillus sp. An172]
MLKKMLSVLMAASMLLSVFAVSFTSASAAESPQITGVTGYAESEDPTRVMGDAVDGNTETFWHTKFNSNEVNFETDTKNSYYLDLGAEYFVDKFEYVPKQRADKNGKITDFELYGTLDTDRESAEWSLITTVNGWTYGTSGEGTESHSVEIADPKPWRMIKITVKGSTKNDGDPNSFICAAEFRVFGTEEPSEVSVWEYEEVGTDSARITKYNGTDVNVVIPETIDGRTVSSIGAMSTSTSVFKEAYDKGVMIESVEMPDTVVLINQHAFRGIASLKTVNLSQNLTEIRTSAFLDCSSLEKIDIPATVTDIGNNAFIGCEALKTVIIRGKNTYINNEGASAYTAAFGFMEISQKTKIEGITMVGVEKSFAQRYTTTYPHIAFMTIEDYETRPELMWEYTINESNKEARVTKYLGNDVNVVVPDKLEGYDVVAIEEYTFKDAYDKGVKVESVVIPDTVIFIRDNAFRGLDSLKSVTVGNSVKTINRYAFRDCTGLEIIDLPASCSTLSDGCFIGCANLKTIIIRSENPFIDNAGASSWLAAIGFMDITQNEKIEGITMVGVPGTNTEKYTQKYPHINFMSIEDYERGGILGDVNGDDELTVDDATLIQMYIVGMPVENFNVELADVNEDGQISIYDATLVQIKIVNK